MAESPDRYITVLPCATHETLYNVVVMREDRDEEYVVQRISDPFPKHAAKALAQSWAAALNCEVR